VTLQRSSTMQLSSFYLIVLDFFSVREAIRQVKLSEWVALISSKTTQTNSLLHVDSDASSE
jgi:hypothetical protein